MGSYSSIEKWPYSEVEMIYTGKLARWKCKAITTAGIKGVLTNIYNSLQTWSMPIFSKDAELKLLEKVKRSEEDYEGNYRQGVEVYGTVLKKITRINAVDEYKIDLIPEGYALMFFIGDARFSRK